MPPWSVRLRLALAALAVILGHGCQRPAGPMVLLESPVEVIAAPVVGGIADIYEIMVRRPATATRIRTMVTEADLKAQPGGTRGTVEAVLRSRLQWKAPYLFVREDNGGGNAWRSDVDHLFKLVAPDRLEWIGTVTARLGPPGSQWQEGHFLDTYDRLEFTPLTSHAMAPGFTLVMVEKDLKFTVDIERTWERGRREFEATKAKLDALIPAVAAAPRLDEAQRREIRGLAMQCLAFTRYCRRITEYDASLDSARKILGEIEEIQEAVGTITPGELSPSLEEILRLRPALRNVLKDNTTGEPEAPEAPVIPPSTGLRP